MVRTDWKGISMLAGAPAYYPYPTPHGPLTVRTEGGAVTHVALGDVALSGERRPSALANRTATELLEYFAGKRRAFDVPTAPAGSAFSLAVWAEVARIPYGESRTAAQVAEALGRAGAHRAVGAALRKSTLAVLVPAHRVTDAHGRAWGGGADARLREALLRMERERAGHGRP